LFFISSLADNLKGIEICENKKPVFIFHGVMGSVMYADVDIPENIEVPKQCIRKGTKIPIWLTKDILSPSKRECFSLYFKLHYDSKTNTLNDQKGVKIYYPFNTSVEGVASMTPINPLISNVYRVFADVVDNLEVMGYKDTDDIQAAAYDWRRLNQGEEWNKDLTKRIEEVVVRKGEKAVLIGHSLGGIIIQEYLESKSKEWVKKYIAEVISVSTPWGGSIKAVKSLLSGLNAIENFIIPNDFFLDVVRTFETPYSLIPNGNYIDSKYFKLNGTAMKANEVEKIFKSYAGVYFPPNTEDMLKITEKKYKENSWKHKCIYGNGIDTTKSLSYIQRGDEFILEEEKEEEKGDGTVQLDSLKGCKNTGAKLIEIKGAGHVSILRTSELIKEIQSSVCSDEGYESEPMTLIEEIEYAIGKIITWLVDIFVDKWFE